MPATAKLQKGIRAAQKGDLKRASELFGGALKADPTNVDALHFGGRIAYQLGQQERGLKMLKRAVALAPENSAAQNDLGLVLKRRDDPEAARACFEASIRIDPMNAPALNNLGTIQRNAGEFETAIETLKEAIKIAPEFAEAHHNLGNCYAYANQLTTAVEHYKVSLELGGDWSDPVTVAKVLFALKHADEAIEILEGFLARNPDHEPARYQVAAIKGEALDAANETYVTTHFDSFAESFDAVLKRLEYGAPEMVADQLAAHLGAPQADRAILDLGCGTGLCGPLVAPYKSQLVGMDLSQEMLRRAKARDCYDALHKAELQAFLMKQPAASFDIAISVDTLLYLGALERTMEGVRHVLRPGGYFIATLETLPDDSMTDYSVDGSGRFKHTQRYIESLGGDGLTLVSMTDVVLRKEAGVDVNGFIFEMVRD